MIIRFHVESVFILREQALSLMRQEEPLSDILAGFCDGVADWVKRLGYFLEFTLQFFQR